MRIADSVLAANLQNVLWIGGGACGGKTTITDLLADKHGFTAYHPEDFFQHHKAMSSPQDHPNLRSPFLGWEWFFNRPLEQYSSDILETDRERFEWVIVDLIKMNQSTTVVMDGHMLEPAVITHIAPRNKVIFLFADAPTIRDCFFAREDKQDILGVINGLKHPEGTRQNVLDVACAVSATKLEQVTASGLKHIVREDHSSVKDTLKQVEDHFGIRNG